MNELQGISSQTHFHYPELDHLQTAQVLHLGVGYELYFLGSLLDLLGEGILI